MIFFNLIPAEIITIFVSASPISELRGAIPLAIGVYHFGVLKAFLLAVLGNIIPAVFFVVVTGSHLWFLD